MNLEACVRKRGNPPDPGPKLVFRDIASNTNERTCIAAVLPEKSCAGNTLASLATHAVPAESAAAVLNAVPVDFTVRLRTAATHLNVTYVSRVAVPRPAALRTLKPPGTASAAASSGAHPADSRPMWRPIWEANRAVAEAYGLGPEDFEHILSTFPVFARKRPEFFRYLCARVEDWKRELGLGRTSVSLAASPRLPDQTPTARCDAGAPSDTDPPTGAREESSQPSD